MMRSIVVASLLGALVAGATAYVFLPVPLPDTAASRPSETAASTETRTASDDWPICTMTVAMPDADWAKLDPEFAAGKKALLAEDWEGAIAVLTSAALRDPRNADIQNYIGYAYRRLRQLGPAMQHYQQALLLNRRHRSAHEHLGELYLALGEPAKAEGQLATLEDICLIPCVETDDLKSVIAAYKTLTMR